MEAKEEWMESGTQSNGTGDATVNRNERLDQEDENLGLQDEISNLITRGIGDSENEFEKIPPRPLITHKSIRYEDEETSEEENLPSNSEEKKFLPTEDFISLS